MIDFISFANQRKPAWQISTTIQTHEDHREVMKQAMTPAACDHIQEILRLQTRLIQDEDLQTVVARTVAGDPCSLVMDYLEGRSLEEHLLEALQKGDIPLFWRQYRHFLQLWQAVSEPWLVPFQPTDSFRGWFGEAPADVALACLPVANIDSTFDNVIIREPGRYSLIDPEWLFDFPIPYAYQVFRAINKFHIRIIDGRFDSRITFDDLIDGTVVQTEDLPWFWQMEESFSSRIFVDNLPRRQPVISIGQLADRQADSAQIFWSDDINEEKSQRFATGSGVQEIVFDLPDDFGEVIRFDPMNHSGIAVIISSEGLDDDDRPVNLAVSPVNALLSTDGIHLFGQDDPQFLIGPIGPGISRLKIRFYTMVMPADQIDLFSKQITAAHLAAQLKSDNLAAGLQAAQSGMADLEVKLDKARDEYEKLELYLTATQEHVNKLENLLQVQQAENEHLKFRLTVRPLKEYFKKILRRLGLTRQSLLYRLIRHPRSAAKKAMTILRWQGLGGLIRYIRRRQTKRAAASMSGKRIKPLDVQDALRSLNKNTAFSILMPVYNVEARWLDLAIRSVQGQTYPNWQLCLVDDASTRAETIRYLDKISDPRISVVRQKQNRGIAGTTNEAAARATGAYLVLMDNDDELLANALLELALAIERTGADILYTDEDKIDIEGRHRFPLCKPDWSPDLLRSQMYIGHLFCFRKSLFEQAGGFDAGFNGSQDYELAFRLTELSQNICHIPRVLYSWREIPSSTAADPGSKPYAHLAGLRAVDAHLKRCFGPGAHADETGHFFVYDARYPYDAEQHLISLIIPMRDHADLTRACLESIRQHAAGVHYEIVIMDNQSLAAETRQWLEDIERQYDNVSVYQADYAFNWSKINNDGARKAKGDILVFLNNDILALTDDWLLRLAENVLRPDIGTAGALLLYEDETIQHAGVIVGMGGWADHVYKGMAPIHFGSPYISPMVARNVMASTGACLAISREHFEELNGFDETFIICGSDVELSIRARDRGYFNIYLPAARLCHLESKSRDSHIPPVDFERSYETYEPFRISGDPFYNPNLDDRLTTPTYVGS